MSSLIYSISILFFVSACTSLPSQPGPNDNVRFFKLREKENSDKYTAVEYWHETPGYLYLYADMLIESIHYEVIQFVKFDETNRVVQTKHFLVKDNIKVIEGGLTFNGQEVEIKDRYFGHERHVKLPFSGELLHPARLERYLTSSKSPNFFKGKKFAFVDWRAIKPSLDVFQIRPGKNSTFTMPMDNGIILDVHLQEGALSQLTINYPSSRRHVSLELVPTTQQDLEMAAEFKFNYGLSSAYQKWARKW